MKMRAYVLAGVLGLVCLVFDVVAFGGAGSAQPAVAVQARNESPIAQTYIVLGRHLFRALPSTRDPAEAVAAACFGDAYPAIHDDPEVALHNLFAKSHGALASLAGISYWGAPVLLLASILLYWFRPRPVHLIRS